MPKHFLSPYPWLEQRKVGSDDERFLSEVVGSFRLPSWHCNLVMTCHCHALVRLISDSALRPGSNFAAF